MCTENEQVEKTSADHVNDLLKMLPGHGVDPQRCISHQVERIMHNDLLTSLEKVLVDAAFSEGFTPDRMQGYFDTYRFLQTLRHLQRCRLKEVVQRYAKEKTAA